MNPSGYQEDEIDLVSLFYYLARKWRSFLLAAAAGLVLGALILAGKGALSHYEPGAEDLLKLEQAYQYQLVYEKQLKYNEELFQTQLSEDQTYVNGELRYYIKAGENTVILGELLDITRSEEYLATLRTRTGWEGSEQYLWSVINYSFSVMDTSSGVSSAEAPDDNGVYGVLTYKVQCQEEICRILMEYIKEWLNEQNETYQEKYGTYRFEKLTEAVQEGDILSARALATDTAVNMQEMLETYLKELTDEQRAYYNMHYLGQTGVDPMRFVKWSAIGALLACFGWGCWWAVAYLLNGTVQQLDLLTEQYGLPLLGRVENAAPKAKGLDAVIARWENARKPAPCTTEYLADALNLMPAEKIVLCQTSDDPAAAALAEELKEHSAKPVCSGAVRSNADTLEAGKKAGGVFLTVVLEKTRLEEFKAELRACKLHELPVLGVIAVG